MNCVESAISAGAKHIYSCECVSIKTFIIYKFIIFMSLVFIVLDFYSSLLFWIPHVLFLSSSLPLSLFLPSSFSLPHFLFLYCDFPAPFAIPRSTFSISQFYFLYFSILFALLYSTVPIYSLHSPLCIYLYMLYPIVIRIAQYVGNCCAIW